MAKLTTRQVATATKPGRYYDGSNLILQVGRTGAKSWLFRYMRNGKSYDMGLGPISLVTLAEARDRAFAYRKLLLDGGDPLTERRASRRPTTASTFRDFAEQFIVDQTPGWRGKKSPAVWRASLKTYVYPTIGDLPLDRITVDHIMQVLSPIWSKMPETADRIRARIAAVLDAGKARGLRQGDNPAAWRGNLKSLLPAQAKVKQPGHFAAMPFKEVPGFLSELRTRPATAARALEFTIFTAARTGETFGARWEEFDLKAKEWLIPGSRMKGGKPHRVPLSRPVIRLLEALPREAGNPHVFVGDRKDGSLSNMAMLGLLRRMGRDDITVHGFRSSFRDWAAETTSHPGDVVEMALAHVVGDEVEAAYRRGDLFEKRRKLMEDWAAFCAPLRRRGA